MAGLASVFVAPAQAQSLSRPGGDQVTPPNLDPRPSRELKPTPEDNENAVLEWGDVNEGLNRTYFRSPLTDKEMDEMDRLKKPRADGGEGLSEVDARIKIMRQRVPRDLNGRDYK